MSASAAIHIHTYISVFIRLKTSEDILRPSWNTILRRRLKTLSLSHTHTEGAGGDKESGLGKRADEVEGEEMVCKVHPEQMMMGSATGRIATRDPNVCVMWFIHMCDVPHLFVGHDSFACGTWLILLWALLFVLLPATPMYVWCDLFICGTWLVHMCDMTHSYVGHDSINLWSIRIWHMTHSFAEYDLFVCGTWLNYTWDIFHSDFGYDPIMRATWLIHMWDITHSYKRLYWGAMPVTSLTWLIHMCNLT